MSLPLLILIPVLTSALFFCLIKQKDLIRYLSIISSGINLGLIGFIFFNKQNLAQNSYLAIWQMPWIPSWNINFDLRLDGLSLILLSLANLMTLLAIWCPSSKLQKNRPELFYGCLLLMLAGINGIFLAFDLFLFFVFWELMLIPLYLLILIFGGEKRIISSTRFLLMTQIGGLFLLGGIIALLFMQTPALSFNYDELLKYEWSNKTAQIIIASLFVLAFLVKLAAFPFHGWLPDLFMSAPTGGLIIGVLIKTGAYGLIRFVLPLFPHASLELSKILLPLGAFGVVYGAILALGQKDLRRVLAYATISHMGIILIGIFSFNAWSFKGVVILLVAQALSTAAILVLLDFLKQRKLSLEIGQASGLWKSFPSLGSLMLVFIMASIGLPGLGNFIGEFLVFYGSFQKNPLFISIALFGLFLGVIYSLQILRKLFFSPKKEQGPPAHDLFHSERLVFALVAISLLSIGLYPTPLLNIIDQSPVKKLMEQKYE